MSRVQQAASVIVLRDAADGIEVLMLRRAERAGDMRSGLWVFPGGVLDAADRALHAISDGLDDATASAQLGVAGGGLDHAVAAIRECYEEVGLLYASPAAGAPPDAIERALAERPATVTAQDFAQVCTRHSLHLHSGALVYYSHWLTPPGLPRRFDTRFYLAAAPAGQQASADGGEALELAWLTPAAALDAAVPRKMLPVQRELLQQLAQHASAGDALAAAHAALQQGRPPVLQMPRIGLTREGRLPISPWAAPYAEIARLDPDGRGDVWCELTPGRVVQLSDRVQRITCANGSMMTGPGTNTYLLHAPGSLEAAVLDPGPADDNTEAHLAAVLAAAAPRRITRILVTHTHKDHSPAVLRLQVLTGARTIGCVALHPEWQDASFHPDVVPAHGEQLPLGDGLTLTAIATPGHASNHLCWLLEEEKLLFTGDHVMQGSTVVINPPDGDMAAYLASLRALLGLDLEWLAPGHGFLMADPHQEVLRLIEHRLAREAKVLAALQQAGRATAPELVPRVYADVPASRHAIAARSLTAHLHKLAADGTITRDGSEHWAARAT